MPAIGSYEERPPRRTAPYFGWRCADASNWSMWMRVGFGCHSLGSLADDFCFRTLLERLLKRTVTDWPYSAILALSFASILRRKLQFLRLRGFGADLRVDVASAPCPQHGASFCLEHRAPTHEGASASGAPLLPIMAASACADASGASPGLFLALEHSAGPESGFVKAHRLG
jgi:hypothetical protein